MQNMFLSFLLLDADVRQMWGHDTVADQTTQRCMILFKHPLRNEQLLSSWILP